MKEYIEKGALLENLKKQYGEELGWQCTVNMSDIGMMIEDATAADVVEVVRCKDCVNYCGFEHCKNGICDEDVVSKRAVYPTDFCSRGERKEQA
jgi:hypothetical protein